MAGIAGVALVCGALGGVVGRLGAATSGASSAAASAPVGPSQVFADSGKLNVGDVVANLGSSVVAVDVNFRPTAAGAARGAGTGVIVTADGQVLTNAHVVTGATSVRVTLNGEPKARAASVIGTDTATDLALLQIDGATGLKAAQLGRSSTVRVGDEVVAIGNALALEGGPTVTKGIISALGRSVQEEAGTLSGLLQTDASISSGNSGGPLISASGAVIGINTAVAASSRSTSAENIGFAIAIDRAKPVIDRLRANAANASAS